MVAMRFTPEVHWGAFDFLVFGVMLAAACGGFEWAARRSPRRAYLAGAALGIGNAFLIVWANLAVGMIRTENDPINLLFAGVLAVALLGSLRSRFQAPGMARAMAVTAGAHALVAGGALAAGLDARGAVASLAMALPWVASAWCFRKAAAPVKVSAPER